MTCIDLAIVYGLCSITVVSILYICLGIGGCIAVEKLIDVQVNHSLRFCNNSQ